MDNLERKSSAATTTTKIRLKTKTQNSRTEPYSCNPSPTCWIIKPPSFRNKQTQIIRSHGIPGIPLKSTTKNLPSTKCGMQTKISETTMEKTNGSAQSRPGTPEMDIELLAVPNKKKQKHCKVNSQRLRRRIVFNAESKGRIKLKRKRRSLRGPLRQNSQRLKAADETITRTPATEDKRASKK